MCIPLVDGWGHADEAGEVDKPVSEGGCCGGALVFAHELFAPAIAPARV